MIELAVLTVPSSAAELAADRLRASGASSIEERALDHHRVELRAALGTERQARHRLGPLPPGWKLTTELVDPEPLTTWRQFARPVDVGDGITIRPAWFDPIDDGRSPDVDDAIVVVIEPGAAFGLGDHPTTGLCAAALRELVRPGDSVLDVGCGSGVLSIVAVKCGADQALAVDTSSAAIEATRDNARRNGVADRVVVAGSEIGELDGQFAVVVANILAPTLVALADDLRRLTAAHGTLVVSGLISGRFDHVVAALAMELVAVDELDGWVALRLRHARPIDG